VIPVVECEEEGDAVLDGWTNSYPQSSREMPQVVQESPSPNAGAVCELSLSHESSRQGSDQSDASKS